MQKMPAPLRFIEPMECREAAELPNGPEWQYEVKLDGYRAIAIKQQGEVELFSRNGKRFNERFPEIVATLLKLRPKSFILDGELVALDDQGRHSFNLLQKSQTMNPPVHFYLFDVIHLDGKDLAPKPLSERRAVLERTFAKLPAVLRLSPVLDADVATILVNVQQLELEGAIAKRRNSPYVSGLAPEAWLKHKTQRTAEFVIGGYIPGAHHLEELLVGRFEGERFLFVESIRAGFVPASRRQVHMAIKDLEIDACPFANLPEKPGAHRMDKEKMRTVRWIEPKLLVELAFNEITTQGHLRHGRFVRLRPDLSLHTPTR
jgi:DNA ligase D-like protein (predicted ligase)